MLRQIGTIVTSLMRSFGRSMRDLLPIVVVVLVFQWAVIRQPLPNAVQLVSGLLLVVVGLTLFVRGLELALFPLGDSLARAFARRGSVTWLMIFAFALGFGTTIAEPALIAVCDEAAKLAAGANLIDPGMTQDSWAKGLRITVAFSVGLALVVGVLRILAGWPMQYLIIGGYILVVLVTAIAPEEIIGVAYDSGGVTTSTITVPLVTALGIGLASSIDGRNPMIDGFGLIALASLTPIIGVMLYGVLV
ncbi:MAG: hypothetical protein ACI91G_001296 [Gammaproteobacteria bacterium]